MAKVEWPNEALTQIEDIAAFIAMFDPAAAASMAGRLFALGNSLTDFPNRGRPGPNGTRELATAPPYIISYRVDAGTVYILGVRHGARRPQD